MLHDLTNTKQIFDLQEKARRDSIKFASAAHELRTPLHGSTALIECALKHSKTPEVIKEQFLRPAFHCQELLHNLINDVLDYSKMKHSNLTINISKTNVCKTVNDIKAMLDLKASSKGLELEICTSDNFNYRIWTDEIRLKQILLNLVGNALKFTEEGSIKICLKNVKQVIEETGKEVEAIEFKVIDTGQGIKEEEINKIFKEFSQAEETNKTTHARGTGLGLMIC